MLGMGNSNLVQWIISRKTLWNDQQHMDQRALKRFYHPFFLTFDKLESSESSQ